MPENAFDPKTLKVMIVDDHDPIRKAMKRVLVSLGVKQIIECFDGVDAIKTLKKQPMDLILLDLYMRKADGFAVIKYIRDKSIGADIPIIVVTGEATKENIVKASDMGADDYIIKPFQADNMETKIISLLNKFFSPPPLLKLLRLGDRLIAVKKYKESLAAYTKALEIDPNSMRAKHSHAVATYYCGQTVEAIKQFQDCIDESPSYYKNFQSLANIYMKLGDHVNAISTLRKELELNPKQADRQFQLAKLLYEMGDPAGAVEHFRFSLREDSKNIASLHGIGLAFAQMEDYEKAIYYFKRMRRHYPKDIRSLIAMVKVSDKANKPRMAELALRDEKSAHPDRLDTYIVLAKFYLSLNNSVDAQKVLYELFLHDKKNLEGLKLKANILLKEKNFTDALAIFNEIAQEDPSLEVLLPQARCMLQLSQLKDAITTLHRCLKHVPDHPMALFLLAMSYKKSMQFSKAYLLFNKAKKNGRQVDKCLKSMEQCAAKIQTRRQMYLNKAS